MGRRARSPQSLKCGCDPVGALPGKPVPNESVTNQQRCPKHTLELDGRNRTVLVKESSVTDRLECPHPNERRKPVAAKNACRNLLLQVRPDPVVIDRAKHLRLGDPIGRGIKLPRLTPANRPSLTTTGKLHYWTWIKQPGAAVFLAQRSLRAFTCSTNWSSVTPRLRASRSTV